MSFPININIPNAPNNPADDQPKMKVNFANIFGYLSVDHVAPGSIGDGFHKEVTYNSFNVPAVPVDPITVAYTNVGIADPTHPQHYWRNSQGIFPLSGVRAFVTYSTAGVGTINGQFNIVSVVVAGLVHTITLQPNAVFGNSPIILVSPNFVGSSNGVPPIVKGYLYTYAANVLTITFSVSGANIPPIMNVLFLQI